ncbi:hypothetical protein [Streptococcus pyogenes]|uniref:hypothetical protein n=1 Tax=Streptococcus pyogenes TaxID=1314 RepID=UPI0010A19796|nr:hypothetical protein [Streptococcus pyogenes]VHC91755.1 phage protein [Streptococcus pyogenes]
MTLVDDFYKQMEPSIKAFLDDNITIADKEEMIMLIKQSYRLKQKKTDEDDKIYEKWMFKNYGDVKLVKKIKRINALAKAREMGL